ncbi:serine/threonine-protein kinase [Curtobacterium luteum]|uniref:serine/threonine-protein kinase n=1 Tax=Curtobacterium luteum TaxID=33881 RepID=UPI0007370851|nr:serine/threonine-protein kinase [Curtobacterium luteum]
MEERVFGGRYRVTGTLGHGGMASVYRAVDEMLGREVAVKVFRIGPVDHGERARAEAEIQVLASLRSPALVTLYDAALDDVDGDSYLIMELVPGSDLATRLREGPLDTVTTARVGAQIAEGLAAAHAQGVVHRDVKPANVLLESDGTHVKLADFGIALLRDSARVTGTGTVMGTAAYIAPEQVMGQPITGKADVYALGLVLLETLSGKRPFPGSAVESATARLARSPEIDQHLPTAWRTLLHVMTATDPDERPTAAEAAERLQALGRDDVAPATQLLPGAPGAMTRAGAAGAAGAAAAAAAAARPDDAQAATARMDATAPMDPADRPDDATRVMPAARASRSDDVATTVLGAAGAGAAGAGAAGAGAAGAGAAGTGGGAAGSAPPRPPAGGPAGRPDEDDRRRRRGPIVLAIVIAVLVIAGIVAAVAALGPGSTPAPTESSTTSPDDQQPSTEPSQPEEQPSQPEQQPSEPEDQPSSPEDQPSEPAEPSEEPSEDPVPSGLPEPSSPASNPVEAPQDSTDTAADTGPGNGRDTGPGAGPGNSGNAPGHGG